MNHQTIYNMVFADLLRDLNDILSGYRYMRTYHLDGAMQTDVYGSVGQALFDNPADFGKCEEAWSTAEPDIPCSNVRSYYERRTKIELHRIFIAVNEIILQLDRHPMGADFILETILQIEKDIAGAD